MFWDWRTLTESHHPANHFTPHRTAGTQAQ